MGTVAGCQIERVSSTATIAPVGRAKYTYRRDEREAGVKEAGEGNEVREGEVG